MATGDKIETRGHITGFKEEINKAAGVSDDAFFTWFDTARDKDAAFIRGSWDFALHVAQPAAPFIANPEKLTALEIGYGGGRLLATAARSFHEVIGIDIHEHNSRVSAELQQRGLTNFSLRQALGANIPLDEAQVDFIYSFIVMQHVEKLDILQRYLAESYRVLKPGGVALIYVGRKARFSNNRRSHFTYWLDRLLEPLWLPRGYKELPARVNDVNLLLGLSFAKRLARKAGFNVQAVTVSRKKVPDGATRFGGQHGLVLQK